MTSPLFETPGSLLAPVGNDPGPTPAAPALGAAGALPVAPDPGDGSGTGPASEGTGEDPQLVGPALQNHGTELPTGADAGPAGGETAVPSAEPAGPALLEIHVIGVPAPQGSKRHVGNGIMVESSSKRLKPWRQDVKQAALDALAARAGTWTPLTDCDIDVTFLMPRPRAHYRTGRYANQLRPDAPSRHTSRPDGDKLMRSTLDALKVAGVYQDDANVVIHTGRKYYSSGHTGAVIHVYTGAST